MIICSSHPIDRVDAMISSHPYGRSDAMRMLPALPRVAVMRACERMRTISQDTNST